MSSVYAKINEVVDKAVNEAVNKATSKFFAEKEAIVAEKDAQINELKAKLAAVGIEQTKRSGYWYNTNRLIFFV